MSVYYRYVILRLSRLKVIMNRPEADGLMKNLVKPVTETFTFTVARFIWLVSKWFSHQRLLENYLWHYAIHGGIKCDIVGENTTTTKGGGSRLPSTNQSESVARRSNKVYVKSAPQQAKTSVASNRIITHMDSATSLIQSCSSNGHVAQPDKNS